MQNHTRTTKPEAKPTCSATDMLYTIERAVENAEYHLMMAEEQLLEATQMLAAYQASDKSADNPSLFARVNTRLHKTLACMKCEHKDC